MKPSAAKTTPTNRKAALRVPVRCSTHATSSSTAAPPSSQGTHNGASRRELLATSVLAVLGAASLAQEAQAGPINPLKVKEVLAARRRKIPESEYTEGEDGLKFYDLTTGKGEQAEKGQRVVVHYDVKWRGITFMTSRQGMGVTGGNPLGFDVGVPAGSAGSTLPGIDLGVRGMRVGGLRRLIVPPNLAYGSKGIGEIPPNANIEVELELLSVKTSALGFQVKLVEG